MSDVPLVLLPGHMCDRRVFAWQMPRLRQAAGSVLVPVPMADTIERMARDVVDAVPGSFSVAGHSLGGIVAMEIARLAPSRIRRLALISTNHRSERSEVAELRKDRVARVTRGQLETVMREEMKPAYLAESSRKVETLDLIMRMAVDLGPSAFVLQSQAIMTRRDYSSTLKQVQLPVALVYGTEDTLCPPDYHFAMSRILPNAVLCPVPDAGHMPMLEQPERFCSHMLAWLETQP
ncbi:MAG: alpha/beta hydrolase [Rhodobacteraceae bacterium]|nr:alpha/beta hydrolase [Paracoccaceae bacterium]